MNHPELVDPLSDTVAIIASAQMTPLDDPGRPRQLVEHAERLASQLRKIPAPYHASLRYHQALLLALGGEVPAAVEILEAVAGKDSMLPEALWLRIVLAAAGSDAASNQLRWAIEGRLGVLLPLSGWGALRDNRLMEAEAERLGRPMTDPGPEEIIPAIDAPQLLRIALLFAEQELDAAAANAYREALYAAFPPPDFPQPSGDSWLSSEVAVLWLETAGLEARLDRPTWMVQALCLAVSADPALLDGATALLRSALRGEAASQTAKPVAEKLLEIGELYVAANLHPRAVSVLDHAISELGANFAERRGEIAAQWQQLLLEYPQQPGDIEFLFGQNLTTTPALGIAIPGFAYGGSTTNGQY